MCAKDMPRVAHTADRGQAPAVAVHHPLTSTATEHEPLLAIPTAPKEAPLPQPSAHVRQAFEQVALPTWVAASAIRNDSNAVNAWLHAQDSTCQAMLQALSQAILHLLHEPNGNVELTLHEAMHDELDSFQHTDHSHPQLASTPSSPHTVPSSASTAVLEWVVAIAHACASTASSTCESPTKNGLEHGSPSSSASASASTSTLPSVSSNSTQHNTSEPTSPGRTPDPLALARVVELEPMTPRATRPPPFVPRQQLVPMQHRQHDDSLYVDHYGFLYGISVPEYWRLVCGADPSLPLDIVEQGTSEGANLAPPPTPNTTSGSASVSAAAPPPDTEQASSSSAPSTKAPISMHSSPAQRTADVSFVASFPALSVLPVAPPSIETSVVSALSAFDEHKVSSASHASFTVPRLVRHVHDVYEKQERIRKAEWDAFFLDKVDEMDPHESDTVWSRIFASMRTSTSTTSSSETRRFHALCERGIPMHYRPAVWSQFVQAHMCAEPGIYQHLYESSTYERQIALDVRRTMPANLYFGGCGPGVPKLHRLLSAYARYDAGSGYCQGMNNLAAVLLLTYTNEEDAFWALVGLIHTILPPAYYASDMLVPQADQQVLVHLVQSGLPKLASHMKKLGVELPAVTYAWFLSLFTACLPIETLFRVWDVLFLDGSSTLFRIAYAILALKSKSLLDTPTAASFYQHLHLAASHLYDADELLLICINLRDKIRANDIAARRAKELRKLVAARS